ncbi:hypothetical protein FG87_40535 [Nocardia vulneris]|uniref:Uncharacterized protein n=2 Tax=Nocardia vulneris TaxID=1141657 RepID=A0ABR4Z3H7_9NOCA|nr:hypothetical protein FG87_40535 [Nocardia vulneris]
MLVEAGFHSMNLLTLLSVTVPPATALIGVFLGQRLAARQDRWRQEAELGRVLWAARRERLAAFVVALNRAIDSTRMAVREGATPEEARAIDDSREELWATAFERNLEASLVFPAEATTICTEHLQAAYRWRRASIEAGRELVTGSGAGSHEDLIDSLRRWLAPTLEVER